MNINPLKVLSDDDIQRIHAATLEVLEKTGIRVELKKLRQMLADQGCTVDEDTRIVRFPAAVVEQFVAKAPREFTICGADPEREWTVSPDHRLWCGLGTAFRYFDPITGTISQATQEDVRKRIVLFDHLERITGSQMDVWAQDIPMHTIHVEAIRAWAHHSTKPYGMGCYGVMATTDMLEMCAIMMGGKDQLREKRPFCSIVSISSPLGSCHQQLEGMLIMGGHHQAVIVAPEAMAGTTAPVTLAGLLVQHNAEIVAHIVMAQVANPGTPVMYGSVSTIAEMRKGTAALGAAETGLISAASAQMGHFYGVPVRAVAGATESKSLDVQAGFERMQSMFIAAAAGANYITCVGTLESSNLGAHELCVIDDEIIGRVERALRGIEVDDTSLALDSIHSAGPGGNYLMDPFTREHFRSEHFVPTVADRESLEGWEASGRKGIIENARAVMDKILAEAAPREIDPHLSRALDDYAAAVAKRSIDDFQAAEWEE